MGNGEWGLDRRHYVDIFKPNFNFIILIVIEYLSVLLGCWSYTSEWGLIWVQEKEREVTEFLFVFIIYVIMQMYVIRLRALCGCGNPSSH